MLKTSQTSAFSARRCEQRQLTSASKLGLRTKIRDLLDYTTFFVVCVISGGILAHYIAVSSIGRDQQAQVAFDDFYIADLGAEKCESATDESPINLVLMPSLY